MASDPARRRSARLLWLGVFSAIAAMEMSGPFWPLYLREVAGLQGDQLLFWSSAVIAAPMLMAAATSTLWGQLGERCGHKWMLLRAVLALALTQWLLSVQSEPVLILALRLLQGALAGVIAAAMAYGLQLSDQLKRGRTLGSLQSAVSAGALLGPVLGGMIAEWAGFTRVFEAAALVCLMVALCWMPGLMAKPKAAVPSVVIPQASAQPAPVARHQTAWVMLLVVLAQLARMMPQPFFALYAEQQLALSHSLLGFIYGATGLAMLIAAPLWGARMDRLSGPQVLHQTSGLALCSALLMLAHLWVSSSLSLFVLRFGWGVCLAATLPGLQLLLSRTARAAGHSVGLGQSMSKLGNFCGYLAGGLAAGLLSVVLGFVAVALVYLMFALVLCWVARRASASEQLKEETPDALSVR